MAEVYAALPQATKDKLAGAEFMHSGRWRYKIRPENAGMDIFEILQMIDAFAPPVRHPAVIEHPYTKEKVLYANRGFTIGIADRSLDEFAELLQARSSSSPRPTGSSRKCAGRWATSSSGTTGSSPTPPAATAGPRRRR